MAQYYTGIVIPENGKAKVLSTHDFISSRGLNKLMEHSYFGDEYVNAVMSLIWKRKGKVAWIGDYSCNYSDDDDDVYTWKMPRAEFMQYYKAAWFDLLGWDEITAIPFEYLDNLKVEHDMDALGLFLVNHTRKCYIDLDEYKRLNEWEEFGGWKNGEYDETIKTTRCVNPLPILTACGNSIGDDYSKCYPCYDYVGIWPFDTFEITDEKPDDSYTSMMFEFTEKKEVDDYEGSLL